MLRKRRGRGGKSNPNEQQQQQPPPTLPFNRITYGRTSPHVRASFKHKSKLQPPPFVCCNTECKQEFQSAVKLKKHYRTTHHGPHCVQCNKGFLTGNQLKQHKYTTFVHRRVVPAPAVPYNAQLPPPQWRPPAAVNLGLFLRWVGAFVFMGLILFLYHESKKKQPQ